MNKPLFALIFLFFTVNAAAKHIDTYSISGKVIDYKTGNAVEYANVYIAFTTQGVSTNQNGEFLIPNIQNGKYQIIVSCVGYSALKADLEISNSSIRNLKFMLNPKIYVTQEVVVIDKEDKDWQNNYELFKSAFLGETRCAEETFIEDPYRIELTMNDKDELAAYTEYPIVIFNRALGYKITYYLEDFSMHDRTTKYSGLPYFEYLEPKNKDEELKWEKNREDVYKGSLRHFLKSICDNFSDPSINLSEIGFYITAQEQLYSFISPKPIKPSSFIGKTNREGEMFLTFQNYWTVKYEPIVREFGKKQIKQISWIKLHGDSVSIDSQGRYYDKYKLQTFGYWATHRMADMLPYDYIYKKKD